MLPLVSEGKTAKTSTKAGASRLVSVRCGSACVLCAAAFHDRVATLLRVLDGLHKELGVGRTQQVRVLAFDVGANALGAIGQPRVRGAIPVPGEAQLVECAVVGLALHLVGGPDGLQDCGHGGCSFDAFTVG